MAVAGKIALVTGASRGIGRGIAMALAKEGARVIITGRHMSGATRPDGMMGGLQGTAEDISAAAKGGGSCKAMVCDHADDNAVESLINEIFSTEGRLDILVNNAFSGVDSGEGDLRGNFWDRPVKHWDAFHVVGLRSHYTATVLSVRHWVRAGTRGALVVNISSAAGCGYVFDVAYGVGKMGVDRLTADSAKELENHGVAVVSIWPGAVATEVVEKNLREGKAKNPEAFTDLESPEMTGRAVVALASDPEVMRWSGKVTLTPELGEEYGFTDIDGKIHWGAGNFMKMMRQAMKFPPSQWQTPKKRQLQAKL
mmetsp:Transcript_128206/g.256048  ORF Transcript_128206/g.256048 Transcript_128206/m.256048 type:complete len:311 (+) Transcript_128206:56-988(+)|eukprot:CAMPEP_0172687270 /NCGR_PEP_ID=MMETSP1074-20121228/21555_1 /TAXON_ID=2916 /ORGANISM="Ceratium fusus, Strain PA161109" /LENGTH=310 /DNA_ID=CAMNT_0013506703 /DNA_START=46 /DNA_END=978 /DNA_ORIENTATION=-